MIDQDRINADLKYYEDRLAEAKASVSQLEGIIRSLRSLSRTGDSSQSAARVQPPVSGSETGSASFSGKPMVEIMRLLLESAAEMHIAEMAKRAITGGYDSGSIEIGKVKGAMSAILSKDLKSGDPKFRRLSDKPGFYTLKNRR